MSTTMSRSQIPYINSHFLPLISHHNARFVFSLFIAIALHTFIIFKIGFSLPDKDSYIPPTLDVIINPTDTHEKLKKNQDIDFYAQSNRTGGGQHERKEKPANVLRSTPKHQKKTAAKLPTTKKKSQTTLSQFTTQAPSKIKAAKLQKKISLKSKPKSSQKKQPQKQQTNTQFLTNLKQQIIDLEADIDTQTKVYSKRSKHKYLNASTAKALDAQYIRQWTRKIERIGNLNYPAKARKSGLSGKLILSVTINPQGKIIDIKVRKSSQHKILDNAAIRIVKLSSPFAPVPKQVLQNNSALVITRTWLFTQKSGGPFSVN